MSTPRIPPSPLQSDLESSVEEVYIAESGLDIPRRPPWTYDMSKEELETTEEREFVAYLEKIHSKYTMAQLSYFEHNLEVGGDRRGRGGGNSGRRGRERGCGEAGN